MNVIVRCPNPSCGKSAGVSDTAMGKSVRCPHCGQLFALRSADSSSPKPPPAEAVRAAYPSPPNLPRPDALPSQLGRFQVRARLGVGAFGTVYRAYDPQLDREVALKVPLPGTLDSPERVERFLREARAAAQLRHPHIVPLFEAGGQAPQYYIAAAFVDGRTLTEAIGAQALDFRQAAQVVRQLAEALAYAHDQGIVHRDVKPANVLLDSKGAAHLLDFGLAHRKELSKLTQAGAILGTPAYMAPEQGLSGEEEPVPASDQYSLGVVLYELLTSRVPFEGPAEVVMFHALHSEPKPPRQVNPQVPLDLETICLKGLAKRPAERYGSCQELAEDLRRWLEGEPIKARRLGAVERVARWCWRNPLVAGLAAAVVLTLLLGTIIATAFAVQARAREHEALANAHWAQEEKNRADQKTRDAELSANEAREQKQRADQKTKDAELSAREAQEQKKRADKKTKEAIDSARQAREQEQLVRRHLYVAQMSLAQNAWRDAEIARLLDLLNEQRPKPGQEDLRGFEWHYLWRLCHSEERTLKGANLVAAYSPDGQRLASASPDKKIKVWDMGTGQQLLTLKGHPEPVRSLAWSPDGQRLASASGDQTVRVWDLASGQEALCFQGHRGEVCGVVFSPDGKRLASASRDRTVRVWDLASGQEALCFQGHSSFVFSVVFSPDGKRLASAGADQTAKVWDAASGQEALTFKGHKGPVLSVAFSPDGKHLASASGDQTVRIWDLATGQEALSFKGHTSSVMSVVFSPDRRRLASAGHDRTVRVWDLATGRETLCFKGHIHWVMSVAFSPDGQHLASSDGVMVKIWNAASLPEGLIRKGANSVTSVAFSPDGQRLASANFNALVKVWDTATGQEALQLQGANQAPSGGPLVTYPVAFSPDGKRLAGASRDHSVKVWDTATGQETLSLKGHAARVGGVAFSPDSKRLASASQDQTVRVWDLATGQEALCFKGHTGGVDNVAFSPDNQRLASASSMDGMVKIWDAATGQEIFSLAGRDRATTVSGWAVGSVAFSPDGRRLASAKAHGMVKIWDTATGQELLTFPGFTGPLYSMACHSAVFSPDGKRLASLGVDYTIKVWDAATGQELLTLKGHTTTVTSLAWSPDGQRLASASLDQTIKIWDATPPKAQ